ncbi:hypothetical protein ABZ468_43745 [Streptomyces sp. NPDC005708]
MTSTAPSLSLPTLARRTGQWGTEPLSDNPDFDLMEAFTTGEGERPWPG